MDATKRRAPGAGRKPSRPLGAKPWQAYVTDAERAALQELLKRLREQAAK